MVVLLQERPRDSPAWMQGGWPGKEGLGLQWGVREMSRGNINGEFSTEYISFQLPG